MDDARSVCGGCVTGCSRSYAPGLFRFGRSFLCVFCVYAVEVGCRAARCAVCVRAGTGDPDRGRSAPYGVLRLMGWERRVTPSVEVCTVTGAPGRVSRPSVYIFRTMYFLSLFS